MVSPANLQASSGRGGPYFCLGKYNSSVGCLVRVHNRILWNTKPAVETWGHTVHRKRHSLQYWVVSQLNLQPEENTLCIAAQGGRKKRIPQKSLRKDHILNPVLLWQNSATRQAVSWATCDFHELVNMILKQPKLQAFQLLRINANLWLYSHDQNILISQWLGTWKD